MGVNGVLAGFPNRMSIEGLTKDHGQGWAEGAEWEAIAKKYEHPLYQAHGRAVEENGRPRRHGFPHAVTASSSASANGEPLDQNVYEGCFWSAVGPLSEKSVAEDGAPQVVPGFHPRRLENHQAARHRFLSRPGWKRFLNEAAEKPAASGARTPPEDSLRIS